VAQEFIPVAGLYAGQRCGGVAIRVVDQRAVRSMSMGMEIASLLQQLYPDKFDTEKLLLLTENAETVRELQKGLGVEQIVAAWARDLQAFEAMRRKYFLYK
jgi:uncharacterized protein YbbC (DUF1343 family)